MQLRSFFFISSQLRLLRLPFWTTITNLGSLEIRVSTYISAKLKKRTYMYDSLQFPVEMNTIGSKTLTTFIPFHTKYDFPTNIRRPPDVQMKSKLRRSVWTISGRLHDVQIQYGSGRLTTTSLDVDMRFKIWVSWTSVERAEQVQGINLTLSTNKHDKTILWFLIKYHI